MKRLDFPHPTLPPPSIPHTMMSHARATQVALDIRSHLQRLRRAVPLSELEILLGGQPLTGVGCAPLWPILGDDPRVVVEANTSLSYRPRLHPLRTVAEVEAHLRRVGSEPLEDVLDVFGTDLDRLAIRRRILVLGGRAFPGSQWGERGGLGPIGVGRGGGFEHIGLGKGLLLDETKLIDTRTNPE